MNKLILFVVIIIFAQTALAQRTIVCGNKSIKIDEKTTIVIEKPPTPGSMGGVINGKAIFLAKPVYSKEALQPNSRGTINVQVTVDEEGNVISATAVSGIALLRKAAVEAARKSKFKKLIIDCEPKKYTGIIVYIHPNNRRESENNQDAVPRINKENVLITDIDATKKAVYLPQPRVPFNVKFPQNAIVKVRIVIEATTGNIIEAKAVSGFWKLRPFAEESARCTKFSASNDLNIRITAFLTYKFDDSNKSKISEMNGGVLNGKAINLPKPIVPSDINASGTVSVRVWLDEEGNVISAKAVSGNVCLGAAAVEAAKKAKFTKTLLSGTPVKISGIIVYNFSQN